MFENVASWWQGVRADWYAGVEYLFELSDAAITLVDARFELLVQWGYQWITKQKYELKHHRFAYISGICLNTLLYGAVIWRVHSHPVTFVVVFLPSVPALIVITQRSESIARWPVFRGLVARIAWLSRKPVIGRYIQAIMRSDVDLVLPLLWLYAFSVVTVLLYMLCKQAQSIQPATTEPIASPPPPYLLSEQTWQAEVPDEPVSRIRIIYPPLPSGGPLGKYFTAASVGVHPSRQDIR